MRKNSFKKIQWPAILTLGKQLLPAAINYHPIVLLFIQVWFILCRLQKLVLIINDFSRLPMVWKSLKGFSVYSLKVPSVNYLKVTSCDGLKVPYVYSLKFTFVHYMRVTSVHRLKVPSVHSLRLPLVHSLTVTSVHSLTSLLFLVWNALMLIIRQSRLSERLFCP